MAFIPRLPTFQCNVTVWKYDPGTDAYTAGEEELVGQVYTQYRGQDDSTSGTLYFEYAAASDILRDLKDYNDVGKSDILTIHFPTVAPRDVAYMVRDVQPRWLKFPNEHLMATLVRLSQLEFTILTEPPPEPAAVMSMSLSMANGTCMSCNAIAGGTDLTLALDASPNYTWENIAVPFDCFSPDTTVEVVLSYSRVTGLLRLLIQALTLGQYVEFRTTNLTWDLSSAESLDYFGGDDVVCGWPGIAGVGETV